MPRNVRPWLPCFALAAAVVALAAHRFARTPSAPPDEPPPPGEPRQWMRAPYLQAVLRNGGLDVNVVPAVARDDAYYVFDGEPDAATADGLTAAAPSRTITRRPPEFPQGNP